MEEENARQNAEWERRDRQAYEAWLQRKQQEERERQKREETEVRTVCTTVGMRERERGKDCLHHSGYEKEEEGTGRNTMRLSAPQWV